MLVLLDMLRALEPSQVRVGGQPILGSGVLVPRLVARVSAGTTGLENGPAPSCCVGHLELSILGLDSVPEAWSNLLLGTPGKGTGVMGIPGQLMKQRKWEILRSNLIFLVLKSSCNLWDLRNAKAVSADYSK